MNNQNMSGEGTTKNITFSSVASWIIGGLLSLGGFTMLFTSPVSGIFTLLAGVIILPVTYKIIKEKLQVSLSRGLKIALIIVLLIMGGSFLNPTNSLESELNVVSDLSGVTTTQKLEQKQPATENAPAITDTKAKTTVPATTKNKPAATSTTSAKTETTNTVNNPTPAIVPVAMPQSNRANVLTILKANASTQWGTNYEMVKYEYDNQVEAYDWVIAQKKYPDIMAKAEQKWGDNYEMVQYEYNNQVEAYEWIVVQTAYPEIMTKAKQKWGTNYEMVKYEYNNQVEAYKSL